MKIFINVQNYKEKEDDVDRKLYLNWSMLEVAHFYLSWNKLQKKDCKKFCYHLIVMYGAYKKTMNENGLIKVQTAQTLYNLAVTIWILSSDSKIENLSKFYLKHILTCLHILSLMKGKEEMPLSFCRDPSFLQNHLAQNVLLGFSGDSINKALLRIGFLFS